MRFLLIPAGISIPLISSLMQRVVQTAYFRTALSVTKLQRRKTETSRTAENLSAGRGIPPQIDRGVPFTTFFDVSGDVGLPL